MTSQLHIKIALALALTTSFQAFAEQPPAPAANAAPVAATETQGTEKFNPSTVVAEFSDGSKILLSQVLENKSKLPAQYKNVPMEKIYEILLNRLVDLKLVLDAAIKAGIDKDAEVLKRIADAQEAIMQKAYLDKEIAKLITDAILQEKYQEILKMLPKGEMEIRLSHILVKTKEEAAAVLKDIKNGKKFEDIVKEKSIDTQTKENAGDLGFVRKGDLPKETSDIVFKAAKGSIVNEVISVGDLGFSVFRVDDKRAVEPPKFEDVKEDITKAIAPEYAVKVIEALRKEFNVKKFGLDGKPLVEKTPEEKKAEAEKEKAGVKDDKPGVDITKLDDKMVVAELPNNQKITLGEIKESVKSLPAQLREAPIEKIYEALLNRKVDMQLLSMVVRKEGIDKDPTVLKKLDEARDALIQKAYLDGEVAKLITPEMLKGKYQEFLNMLPKDEMEVRLRHILVKTKREADEIMKSLKSGAKFDDLVKSKSADEQTKENGGELGYVRKSELPKEFSELVFKAAKATLLPEPINLGELGYSIVRVEDKRAVTPPSLEEVKVELLKIISAEQAVKVLEKLRKDATVKKFDMEGKPLVEKTPEEKKVEETGKKLDAQGNSLAGKTFEDKKAETINAQSSKAAAAA
ncbi:MAG: peptidylprolyl isomerase [Alphaproteobacteria bacterium]|nr:peptidylprolyl isomerase [Alphaproteobacteria bacterium]